MITWTYARSVTLLELTTQSVNYIYTARTVRHVRHNLACFTAKQTFWKPRVTSTNIPECTFCSERTAPDAGNKGTRQPLISASFARFANAWNKGRKLDTDNAQDACVGVQYAPCNNLLPSVQRIHAMVEARSYMRQKKKNATLLRGKDSITVLFNDWGI